MENHSSRVNYFCVGLGIGALAGILFAPKSGAETRDDVTRKIQKSKQHAQAKARELRERAEGVVESGKQATSDLKRSISGAFTAGREAYRQEMSKVS